LNCGAHRHNYPITEQKSVDKYWVAGHNLAFLELPDSLYLSEAIAPHVDKLVRTQERRIWAGRERGPGAAGSAQQWEDGPNDVRLPPDPGRRGPIRNAMWHIDAPR